MINGMILMKINGKKARKNFLFKYLELFYIIIIYRLNSLLKKPNVTKV